MSSKFQFMSLAKGLPETKQALHQLAFFAHAQFIKDGGVVKVGQPAFAVGCEMSSNVRSLIRRDQRLSLG